MRKIDKAHIRMKVKINGGYQERREVERRESFQLLAEFICRALIIISLSLAGVREREMRL